MNGWAWALWRPVGTAAVLLAVLASTGCLQPRSPDSSVEGPVRVNDDVRVWTERVTLPTYDVRPDPVPRFQATDDQKFYPYPAQYDIAARPVPRIWTLLCLENQYLRVKVMPQLGGRVYTIYDKLAGRDVIYRPAVIKPATAGIRGAWIAGGIEYNFPDCHTVTTHDEIDWTTQQHPDGSASILIGDIERISRMAWSVEFRLEPGRASLQSLVRLYNRTPQRQRYFYWTNAAVVANEHTQIVFPFPKVAEGNGRPDILDWPIRDGRDFRWLREYDGGVSVGGMGGAEDFFGSFDHQAGAGIAYCADRHALPARKFWTWGLGALGRSWARRTSDDNRGYLELQAGPAITSSEFAWLEPYESRRYDECWIPVTRIGPFARANRQAVVRLTAEAGQATLGVLPLTKLPGARVQLLAAGQSVQTWRVDLSPERPLVETVPVADCRDLRVVVRDGHGRTVIEHTLGKYAEEESAPREVPTEMVRRRRGGDRVSPARRAELFWLDTEYVRAAETIEAALAQSPDDPRVRFEAGCLRLFQGLPEKAADLFEPLAAAPDDSSRPARYYLALAKFRSGDLQAASSLLEPLLKTPVDTPQADTWLRAARLLRAQLLLAAGRFREALGPLQAVLRAEPDNTHAAALALYAARHDTRAGVPGRILRRYLDRPDLEPMARLEAQVVSGQADETLARMLLRDPEVAIDLACDYIAIADFSTAQGILTGAHGEVAANAMTWLLAGRCAEMLGRVDEAADLRRQVEAAPAAFVMPSRPEELAAAEAAVRQTASPRGAYYAGMVLMRLMRYDEAVARWQQAVDLQDDNAMARRCLGMTLVRLQDQPDKALPHLERAVQLASTEADLYLELADLLEDMGRHERVRQVLQQAVQCVPGSDRLWAELVSAHLALGEHSQAAAVFSAHPFVGFQPLHGLAEDHAVAWLGVGLRALLRDDADEALAAFDTALAGPNSPAVDESEESPGTAMLRYWRANVLGRLGRVGEAEQSLRQAASEVVEGPIWQHGYHGVLNTVHAALAARSLGESPQADAQLSTLARQVERLRRWENDDWAAGFVAFSRTWLEAVQPAGRLDLAGVTTMAGGLKVEPCWARLSALLVEALNRSQPSAPATAPVTADR